MSRGFAFRVGAIAALALSLVMAWTASTAFHDSDPTAAIARSVDNLSLSTIAPTHYSDTYLSPIEDDVPEFPTADSDVVSTPEETETEPAVSVSPAGRDLSPYSPLTITFRNPPQESNPQQVVSIDPHLDGTLGWLDDSTLLFRPAAPGWQQGQQYQLVILAAALGAESDFSHTFIAGGGLEVAYFVPGDGDIEVPVDAQILVQFNRSVAPLTVLSNVSGPSALEFQPPLEGVGEWLNTSLFRFKPDSLAPSTKYTVHVRVDLTSAIGEHSISDISWSFTTVQPAVVAVTPPDGAEHIALDSPIVVTFNQPMDRESVESRLQLGDAGSALVGTFDWNDDLTTVTFTPADALDLGRVYNVVAPEGLRSANGGASLAMRSSSFRTIPWPRLIQTRPRNGATEAGRTSISLRYNTLIDLSSFEDRIAISGIDPSSIELSGHYWSESFGDFTAWFDVNLDYSTTYTVNVAAGVLDQDGRPAPAHEFRFTTDHPPNWPILSLASRSSFTTMSADRDQVVHFNAARIGEARFELFELSQQESDVFLRRGAIYGARSILAEAASIPASDWPDREPVRQWSVEIEPSQQEEVRLHSTVLGGDTPLERGHYLLVATPDQTWDGEEEQYGRWLMVSVVDTAMIIKHAAGELVVWALDHDTGEPLAEVPVLAASMGYTADSPFQPGNTDADGVARIAMPIEEGFYDEPYWLYVTKIDNGANLGVSATWWDRGISPWEMDVPTRAYFPGHRAHLFSERPIYRPGETVYFKGVIRFDSDGTYTVPDDNETFRLEITDPQFNSFLTRTLKLSDLGTFNIETTLPVSASTGTYQVKLFDTNEEVVKRTSFSVEEFRPPEFQIDVAAADLDLVAGDATAVEALATFFFGGGVAGARVNWQVDSWPSTMRVAGYRDFTFSDRAHRDSRPRIPLVAALVADGETTTDASGAGRFDLSGELTEEVRTTELNISTTVTDASGQAIAANTEVTVHPARWYVGIRPESRLARAGVPTTINLVSVDFRGTLAPERPVTIRLYKREWTSSLDPETGLSEYQISETEVDAWELTTDENAIGSVDLVADEPGSYVVVGESTDEQGRIAIASRSLWVRGGGRASWPESDNGAIRLIADREEYQVGDVAEILVPASFAGATGLVTLERGSVLTTEVRHFPTNSEVLRVPIEDWHIPNVFVGVTLYRPPTTDDPYPRYNIGYAELRVSSAPRQLEVSIEPEQAQAEPGETISYQLQVRNADGHGVEADVSVGVVDQAVLSLLDQAEPNGMRVFWSERRLGVRNSSSLAVSIDALNRQFMNIASGDRSPGSFSRKDYATLEEVFYPQSGGGGEPAPDPQISSAQADEALRSDFRNTALWLGQVRTDANGRASFSLPLPDNATTWRIRARASDAETQVGEDVEELLATRPLLVRPALPRFLRVGDEVTLRSLVRNGTGLPRRVYVSIEARGVVLRESGKRSELVANGSSYAFGWKARATEEGVAVIRFRAVTGRFNDAVEITIPIHPAVTPESTATGGVVRDYPTTEPILLPDDNVTRRGSLEVALQASLVGTLEDELHQMMPRGTRESNVRVASRILALAAVEQAKSGALTDQQREQLQMDIEFLVREQSRDGGWGWCRACEVSSPTVTAWALLALSNAQAAGFDVPEGAVIDATAYMNSAVLKADSPNLQAFLLYAAAKGGSTNDAQPPVSQWQQLVDQHREELTHWGRAYAILGLLAAGHDRGHEIVRLLLNDLNAAAQPSANGNQWADDPHPGSMHSSSVRITAIVLAALVEAEPEYPLIEETVRWLVHARGARRWQSSVDRAQAVSALAAFARGTGELEAEYDYRVLLDTTELLNGTFNGPAGASSDSTELPLDEFGSDGLRLVHFERDPNTAGRMYYTLNLQYSTPATEVSALNRGIAVSRRYSRIDDPDRSVNRAALGEVVRVELTVVVSALRHYVTIADHLPAGLEPIVPRLKTTAPWLREQLAEERATSRGFSNAGYYAPWFAWYFSPWDQVDTRDAGVTLSAQQLVEGVHRYIYYARATTPGDFFVSPAHAQESYFPDVFGRSDSTRFSVHESLPICHSRE